MGAIALPTNYCARSRETKASQRCPACGHVHKKKLSERVHLCAECGFTEPRDVASARIVYGWVREQLASDKGQERYPRGH